MLLRERYFAKWRTVTTHFSIAALRPANVLLHNFPRSIGHAAPQESIQRRNPFLSHPRRTIIWAASQRTIAAVPPCPACGPWENALARACMAQTGLHPTPCLKRWYSERALRRAL